MTPDEDVAGNEDAGEENRTTRVPSEEPIDAPQEFPPPPSRPSHPPPPHPPPPPAPYPQYTPSERAYTRKREDSAKPTVVGALLIIVAIIGFIMASLSFVGWSFFEEFDSGADDGVVTLRGEVQYINGTGVPGATVSVVGEALSTTTDDEGNYIIYNVPVGDQRIQVSKEGYKTLVRKVTITELFDFGDMDGNKEHWSHVDFTLEAGTGTVEVGKWTDGDFPFEDFRVFMAVCSAIIIIMSVLAMWGGYNALKRKNLSWVIVGCVAGIFTVGFGAGAVLSFVALFVTLLGMDEFDKAKASD